MQHIRSEVNDSICVITLARGKANALNAEMVEELISAFDDVLRSDDVRGVVLASDRPRFFSGGFDASEVFLFGREEMARFFGRFIDLYEKLLRFPKPLVGAISGHAYAGGAVLALVCDLRVMARGPFGFALNEINLGIVMPPGMIRMAVNAVGTRSARELVVWGSPLNPEQALEVGLATELAEPDTVLERALARARELAEKPPEAFAALKQLFLETTGHHPSGSDREHLNQFIEQWFSPESVKRKQDLLDSLRR